MENKMNIAEEIINICKEKGIKVKAVENYIGVSNGYIRNKCESKDFPFIKLIKICEFIGVPIWYFNEDLKRDIFNTISSELNAKN